MRPRKKSEQQSSQVSQEELAKTQVLNLDDVHEIASYEKRVSKKPAAILAVLGLFSITMGLAYPGIANYAASIADENKKPNEEIIDNNSKEENHVKVTSCRFVSEKNPDGTSGIATYDLIFDENKKLQKYTMTLEMNPLPSDVNGLLSVQNYYNNYRKIDDLPLNGYTMHTEYTETGMKAVAKVDLSKLDITTLTQNHLANYFALVPFKLNEDKSVIVDKLEKGMYICK